MYFTIFLPESNRDQENIPWSLLNENKSATQGRCTKPLNVYNPTDNEPELLIATTNARYNFLQTTLQVYSSFPDS